MEQAERSYQFTLRALNEVYGAVDHPDFADCDARMIYDLLRGKSEAIPFCDYLKRYIYINAGLTGSFSAVPAETYQEVIVTHFRETGTPFSFTAAVNRPSQQAGHWLSQQRAARESVLLLGFGLRMGSAEVNALLTNALSEPCLDESDPKEALCAYCYDHQRSFSCFSRLWQTLLEAEEKGAPPEEVYAPHTAHLRQETAAAERSLLSRLAKLKEANAPSREAQTRQTFDRLHQSALSRIAALKGAGSRVGNADIERVLYSSVPATAEGNISLSRPALLSAILRQKLSRQRIYDLQRGRRTPDRWDLLNIAFLNGALGADKKANPRLHSYQFSQDINRTLTSCGYGELYPANPYDAFLMMCILTADPLSTFNEVLEYALERKQ